MKNICAAVLSRHRASNYVLGVNLFFLSVFLAGVARACSGATALDSVNTSAFVLDPSTIAWFLIGVAILLCLPKTISFLRTAYTYRHYRELANFLEGEPYANHHTLKILGSLGILTTRDLASESPNEIADLLGLPLEQMHDIILRARSSLHDYEGEQDPVSSPVFAMEISLPD
ncbi:MAG TPA: hypothetical protein VKK79_25240 [Candidatus Lokiarchaeia archaeon]|nr:hypothetical protein [Candidatus Lokiarchaeia archaeon]